tara:strand:- start:35194 stop:35769 length:576 start_codon:yes stop_codon:yes gene_type:complete
MSSADFPSKFTAGETIRWRLSAGKNHLGEDVSNSDYALTYYLRTNRDGQGKTVTGTNYSTGWEFVLTSAESVAMDAGDWEFQAIATKSDDTVVLAKGRFQILASLSFTGTSGAHDPRTDTEKELEVFVAAINALGSDKTKQFTIGTRTFSRIDLPDLIARESQLRGRLWRERRADLKAQGLGDPNRLHVRF